MPINYKKYPPNWKELRAAVLERANNKCEKCGLQNHSVGYRNDQGNFIPECGNILLDCYGNGLSYPSLEPLSYKEAKEHADFATENDELGYKYIVVVLTIAHLDHDEENHNVKIERLIALCQKCHLNYDIPEKKKRRRNKKAVKDLFE